jgi:O-methyltransferase involved in polyketide biosynthesis
MSSLGSARSDGDSWDLASSVGATATMVAASRALASREPDPLLDDRFAEPLVRAASMQKPQTGLASPSCRTPPGQSAGLRQTHPGIVKTPRFRCHLMHFRHVNSESLALAFPIPT